MYTRMYQDICEERKAAGGYQLKPGETIANRIEHHDERNVTAKVQEDKERTQALLTA